MSALASRCVSLPATLLLVNLSLAGLATASASLKVTQFGAVPDDDRDDTAAFLAAFQAAQTNSLPTLEIPPGRYDLRADGNPSNPGVLFPLYQQRGFRLRGRQAELSLSGTGTLFGVAGCQDVEFAGFTVDWKRPAFSQGTVTAAASNSFEVAIEDAFPVAGGEPVGAFMDYNPRTRLPDGYRLDVYDSVARTELLRPQVLRVHLNRPIEVPVGTLLVLRHQVYGPAVFHFHRCAEVRVRDVTVFTVAGMGLFAATSTNLALERFQVRLRPGSGRLMSATADATHFAGCRGTLRIEDCLFEGMGDDGVNVKSGLYLTVRERVDDHTVLGRHNLKMIDLPDAGDVLELLHADTLLPFATNLVRTASLESGSDGLHRVTFAQPLPAELREGDLLGNASRTPQLRMRGCTVRNNRARGVLCQTRDAVIEDCTFQNCTGPGVMVLTEAVHFFESIGTRHVTVRNNRFENCNRGAAAAEAALVALAWLKGFALPPQPGVHREVRLEGNRIVSVGGSGICAAGVDGLIIRSNVIRQAALPPTDPSRRHAIRVVNSARVVVADNDIDPADQGQPMDPPVLFSGTSLLE